MIRWWLGWLGEVLPIECERGLSVIEMEKVLFDSVFLCLLSFGHIFFIFYWGRKNEILHPSSIFVMKVGSLRDLKKKKKKKKENKEKKKE
jgi:hypothetical protein